MMMSRIFDSSKWWLVAGVGAAVIAGVAVLVMSRGQAPNELRSGDKGETRNEMFEDRVGEGHSPTAQTGRPQLASGDAPEDSPSLNGQSTTENRRSVEATTLVLQPPWEVAKRSDECDSSGCESVLEIDPLTGRMRLAIDVQSVPSSPQATQRDAYATFRAVHRLTRPVHEINYEFHVDLGQASATRWGAAWSRGRNLLEACRGCGGDASSAETVIVESAEDGREVSAQGGIRVYRLRFYIPDGKGKTIPISPGDLRLSFQMLAQAGAGTYAPSNPLGSRSAPTPGRGLSDMTSRLFKVVVLL